MLACSLHVAGLSHTEFDPQQPSFIQIDTERSGRLQRKRPNLGVYSCAPGRPCRFCALVWLGGVVCSLACVRVCMGSREYLRGMQLFLHSKCHMSPTPHSSQPQLSSPPRSG